MILRRGSTDSELIFLLLLTFGLMDDPALAINRVLGLLAEHSCYGTGKDAVRLTCVLCDGETLYAFPPCQRRARAHFVSEKTMPVAAGTLASEPLDGHADKWISVEPDVLVTLTRAASSKRSLIVNTGSVGAAVA